MQTRAIDRQPGVSIRRVHALINPASTGGGPGAADALAALFAELGLDHKVSRLARGRFEDTVRAALDAGPDLIVVLGGDGTSRLVAEMCGPNGPLIAPLSGGTMNKLGRAIYGPAPWREALMAALTDGEARAMPGGEVGGHAFYCAAVLGSPALWSRSREAVRAHRLSRAWRRATIAARRAFQTPLRYAFDSTEIGRGSVVGLITPTMSRAFGDDDQALEAAILDLPGPSAGLRLLLSNLFGDWRDSPNVTTRPCVRGQAWAHHAIPAMLDGEFYCLHRQVEVRFMPNAFRALAPAADPAKAA